MVKQYKDFKAAPAGTGKEIIPAGGYVAKVMNTELKKRSDGKEYIQIAFDIAEGEFEGFFAKDYRNNTNDDRRWRGNYYLNIPVDDGSEMDGWIKRSFGNAVWAFEESNAGYHWDWDEAKLKGKMFGVLFRNKEWEFNGRTGWTTEASAVTDINSIRNGKFKVPKDRPLKNKPVETTASFEEMAGSEDDLPF